MLLVSEMLRANVLGDSLRQTDTLTDMCTGVGRVHHNHHYLPSLRSQCVGQEGMKCRG